MDWWDAPLPDVPVVEHDTSADAPLYTLDQVAAAVGAAVEAHANGEDPAAAAKAAL